MFREGNEPTSELALREVPRWSFLLINLTINFKPLHDFGASFAFALH